MLKDRYICGQCGYNFDLAIGGFHTADVKTHCDKVMRVERVNVVEPPDPLEEKDAEIARLKQRLLHAEQVGLIYGAFCDLRGASQWTLELYWDGSGQIVSNVPVNAVCEWDSLEEAREKIARLSATQGKKGDMR